MTDKYITIGDEVISSKNKIIGTVSKITGINVRNRILYRVKTNYKKTGTIFGIASWAYGGVDYDMEIHEITSLKPTNMYNKKYERPVFDTITIKDIKKWDLVTIVDNDFIKKLLESHEYNNYSYRCTTDIFSYQDYCASSSVFDAEFYVTRISCGSDLVECTYITYCGATKKIVVHIDCVQIKKKNSFLNRFFLKRKYGKK